jgi:Cys-rich repeat protein
MDTRTFDALTRRFGAQRNRRAALKAFAGGLVGLGLARDVAAQIATERANCGQPCRNVNNTNCDGNDCCNAGLRCSGTGNDAICVRESDSTNTCNRNIDCTRSFELCRNGRCRNLVVCNRCRVTEDCSSGEVCRNGNCGECTRDQQCPGREVCRNGRCERGRNDCNRNRDCPRGRRCRNGRCVRK